ITVAQGLGWGYRGVTASPITGPAGNAEYLLWLLEGEGAAVADLKALTTATLQR
ncbi:MAG: TlyA family rRNA (cytidine-2'-O)-methyltransferase, partial [Spirulina sp. DLM2.Bin59]